MMTDINGKPDDVIYLCKKKSLYLKDQENNVPPNNLQLIWIFKIHFSFRSCMLI